jgi:hypothetical protein
MLQAQQSSQLSGIMVLSPKAAEMGGGKFLV